MPVVPAAPASGGTVKVQNGGKHRAPCGAHLQSASVAHSPSAPCGHLVPAGTQDTVSSTQSQTWLPHAVPGQSTSRAQAAARAGAAAQTSAASAATSAATAPNRLRDRAFKDCK